MLKIKNLLLKLLFIIPFAFISPLQNHTLADNQNQIIKCRITPGVWEDVLKPKIAMDNNLLQEVGSPYFASGNYIEIRGRILDSNCTPVSNAIVEIWQLDQNGYDVNYYSTEEKSETELSLHKKNLVTNKVNKYFTGSGSTTTDNQGYYKFKTIIPGSDKKDRAAHINFNIHHRHFADFQTQMYLPPSTHSSQNSPHLYNHTNSKKSDSSPMFNKKLHSNKNKRLKHQSSKHSFNGVNIHQDKFIKKLNFTETQKKSLIAKRLNRSYNITPNLSLDIYQFNIVLDEKNRYKKY